jgi:hypothetical protein
VLSGTCELEFERTHDPIERDQLRSQICDLRFVSSTIFIGAAPAGKRPQIKECAQCKLLIYHIL